MTPFTYAYFVLKSIVIHDAKTDESGDTSGAPYLGMQSRNAGLNLGLRRDFSAPFV